MKKTKTTRLTGGCFCGAIRYTISPPFMAPGICHCLDCRKVSGSAFLSFVGVKKVNYKMKKGKPASIIYSNGVKIRTFCSSCGSPLTWQNSKYPELVEITVCTLDDPEKFPPRDHVWNKRRLSWLKMKDELPIYRESSTK